MGSALLFLFAVIFGPPLTVGLIRKAKAGLQNRIGAAIWQPAFDLLKLFQKDEIVSRTASWLFRFAAAFNVAAMLYLALILPWYAPKPGYATADVFFILYLFAAMRFVSQLAAMDTASAFGAFAASREAALSVLLEPVPMLSLCAVAVLHGSSNLQVVFGSTVSGTLECAVWVLSGTALLLASLVELSRMPVDDPTTHLELTMVHEAMILEASGKNLALFEYAHALKLLVLFGLASQCFLKIIPSLASLSTAGSLAVSVSAISVLALIVATVETVAVKLNWRKAPDFIAYSFTLALLAAFVALGARWI